MKKYLFLPIILMLVSCTALNNNVTEIEKNFLSREVSIKTAELLKTVNSNEYSKLEEIFLPTLKNKIILNELKKYNLSELTFIISEATIISKNKAKSMMIINYDTTSSYYVLTWEKDIINGQWKILDVAEKK